MAEPTDSPNTPPAILVFCTAPDIAHARRIAGELLDARLAACVSLIPGAESHYTWEGSREASAEVLMKIKTTAACWEALCPALQKTHPYDCPEILRVDVADGSAPYLRWLGGCVGEG